MPYLCTTCTKEFETPAAVPRKGFVGRYAAHCPEGHPMLNASKIRSYGVSITIGFLLAAFASFAAGLWMWISANSRQVFGIDFRWAVRVIPFLVIVIILGGSA